MPRNSSGSCTLAEAAFVASTPIRAATMNSDLSDIADMLTDSLSRSGKGSMQATLDLATTGFAYSADPDTGMSRPGANTQVVTCGGEDWTFTADDLTTPGGVSLLPLIGEIRMWALPTAPSGWIFMRGQAATLASYPLWRAALIAAGSPYGTSGSDPKFPNMQCRLPAGFDADGLGLLTGSTTLGNTIGAQSQTIGQTNLPAVTWPNTLGVTLPGTIGSFAGRLYSITAGGGAAQTVFNPQDTVTPTQLTVGITTTPTPPTVTGDVTSGGSGTALTTVPPAIIINFIGRAA